MRNRSRTAAKLTGAFGVLALMATLLGLAPSSAGAAEVPFEYIMLDGSEVTVGDTVFPLFDPANPTSAGLVGVIDDVTGDFEADMTIPARQTTQRVEAPLAGNIDLLVEITADPVIGNVDPATNEVEASTEVDVSMTFQQLVPDSGVPPVIILNTTCTMADIPMELSSSPDGAPFDPNANPTTFAVAGAGFEFPEPDCGPSGTAPDPTPEIITLVRDGLIENLALPNSDTTAFLTFESGTLTPPTPPTPPTTPSTTVAPATTVAPSTAPAAAVRATPRVTG